MLLKVKKSQIELFSRVPLGSDATLWVSLLTRHANNFSWNLIQHRSADFKMPLNSIMLHVKAVSVNLKQEAGKSHEWEMIQHLPQFICKIVKLLLNLTLLRGKKMISCI